MILTNLGILSAVYLGKKLMSRRVTHKKNKLRAAGQRDDTSTSKNLQHAKIGGVALATVSIAYLAYPPLRLFNVVIISYNAVPVLQNAVNALSDNKKISNESYSALLSILLLGFGSYFAAAMHNLIYHLSNYFIGRSRQNSARLAADAYQQVPERVWINAGSVEQQIPLSQVQKGDKIIVSSGETIAVDGVIDSGFALIDQQALTGEANPLEKTVGNSVLAATVVLSGRIVIIAAHSGEENRINKLNNLLQQTRDYKTQLQLKGEAWANRMSLPLIAGSASLAPIIGVSPALALLGSAPINTVRSMLSAQTTAHLQRVLQHGVLIKDGRVLEELTHIDTIVFDKTGTLTQSQAEVAAVISCADNYQADEILAFAAAAEQRLEHPIARAIVAEAEQRSLLLPEVVNSRYSLGLGVSIETDKHNIQVGSQRFIQQESDSPLPDNIAAAMQAAAGHTFILIAIDGDIQGALELRPRLRPDVPGVLSALRQRHGIQQLLLLSGDQQAPTKRLADSLGLDAAYGEVLPQDKAAFIKQLQVQGRRVCFVGDGLNDAIAMKQANVSVCLSSAAAITNETAQVILLNDTLSNLNQLFAMAEQLHQSLSKSLNLWIGFGVSNALAVPLLSFGPFQSSLLYAGAYSLGIRLSRQLPETKN